jgi:hypothetical protein
MPRNGRPTKLTRKLIGEIALIVSAGNTLDKSAEYHGVCKTAAYNWQARGRKEIARLARSKRTKPKPKERLHVEFAEAIKKARAKAQVRNVAIINEAAKTTWTAAAWWLERTDRENWGRPHKQGEGVSQNVMITVEEKRAPVVSLIADPEVRAAMAIVQQKLLAGGNGNGKPKTIEAHEADPADPAAH